MEELFGAFVGVTNMDASLNFACFTLLPLCLLIPSPASGFLVAAHNLIVWPVLD